MKLFCQYYTDRCLYWCILCTDRNVKLFPVPNRPRVVSVHVKPNKTNSCSTTDTSSRMSTTRQITHVLSLRWQCIQVNRLIKCNMLRSFALFEFVQLQTCMPKRNIWGSMAEWLKQWTHETKVQTNKIYSTYLYRKTANLQFWCWAWQAQNPPCFTCGVPICLLGVEKLAWQQHQHYYSSCHCIKLLYTPPPPPFQFCRHG